MLQRFEPMFENMKRFSQRLGYSELSPNAKQIYQAEQVGKRNPGYVVRFSSGFVNHPTKGVIHSQSAYCELLYAETREVILQLPKWRVSTKWQDSLAWHTMLLRSICKASSKCEVCSSRFELTIRQQAIGKYIFWQCPQCHSPFYLTNVLLFLLHRELSTR